MGFDQRELMEEAIHEYFGDEPHEIIKDMNGKDRMLFIYHNLEK
jgi:release factor glutamine methyltransferase